jgi:hypothetical protein
MHDGCKVASFHRESTRHVLKKLELILRIGVDASHGVVACIVVIVEITGPNILQMHSNVSRQAGIPIIKDSTRTQMVLNLFWLILANFLAKVDIPWE